MKRFKEALKDFKERWQKNYITSKVLVIICMICFIAIIISVFDEDLEATGNLIIIRNVFSSVVGYMLESSTKSEFLCADQNSFIRNLVVSTISIITTLVIILCYIYGINPDNPSLILLKNILFSCIGFLISASKSCSK